MGLTAERIVVPVDFSESCPLAVRTALEIATDRSGVHLLHVLAPLEAVSPGVVWGGMSDEKRMKSVQTSFEQFLRENNLGELRSEVRVGTPGLEIADFADEIGADLIVMPTHGYHGVKRLMLGSVTERVLRHARCSVLALRTRDAE